MNIFKSQRMKLFLATFFQHIVSRQRIFFILHPKFEIKEKSQQFQSLDAISKKFW